MAPQDPVKQCGHAAAPAKQPALKLLEPNLEGIELDFTKLPAKLLEL